LGLIVLENHERFVVAERGEDFERVGRNGNTRVGFLCVRHFKYIDIKRRGVAEFPRFRDYLAPRKVGDVFFVLYIIFGQEVPKKCGKCIMVVFLVELHASINSSDSTISLPVSFARAAVSKILSRYFCGTSSLSSANAPPRSF